MIYAVFGGCYSDWYCVGYFTNREEADKYCAKYGPGDYYVEEIKNLSNKFDVSDVTLKYEHEIVFDYCNQKWNMRNEPTRYQFYSDKKLRSNSIRDSRIYKIQPWIVFKINLQENNRKKAEKIAQDYLYQLIYESDLPDDLIDPKVVNELNKRFQEERRIVNESKI